VQRVGYINTNKDYLHAQKWNSLQIFLCNTTCKTECVLFSTFAQNATNNSKSGPGWRLRDLSFRNQILYFLWLPEYRVLLSSVSMMGLLPRYLSEEGYCPSVNSQPQASSTWIVCAASVQLHLTHNIILSTQL